MKKKSLLLTAVATLGLTAATMAQNVPNYVPTNGLVGWWPFNGNANDESGNGNNGTVNGATLTSDRFGNTNKAYSFNGVDNNIQIPHNILLNPQRPFTVSLYGLTNTPNVSQTWVSTNPFGVYEGWDLMPFQGTGMNYEIAVNNQWNSYSTNFLYAPNTWTHSTYVFGQDSIKVYINGVLFETTSFPQGNITYGNNLPLMIGSTVAGFHYLNGKIDDIGFWNRALTHQEINDLYNGNICYQTITVTDTLLINMGITGFNPITYNNTIKIFPNPTNDHITINYGNFASLNGYQLKIENSLGQQVFQTNINQQSDYLSLTNWGGNGLYFVRVIDPQGNTIDIRKIVLQ